MEIRQIPLAGNEAGIHELYRAVYADTPDRIPSREVLRWRFGSADYASSIWVAEDDGAIVGLRPLQLNRILCGSAIHPAIQMMSVMVHPAYQGRGIFSRLMDAAWKRHAQDGVLAFTYPNPNSIKAYARWPDWFRLVDMGLWIRMIAPRRLSERRGLLRYGGAGLAVFVSAVGRRVGAAPAKDILVQPLDEALTGVEALWERERQRLRLCVARDRAYIRWRYAERPDLDYLMLGATRGGSRGASLCGYLVARSREMFGLRLGLIVDFLVDDGDPRILSALIEAAAAHLEAQGAEALGLQYVGPGALTSAFRANGFVRIPRRLLPRDFAMYVRRTPRGMPEDCLEQATGRYFTWGDNDAV